MYPTNHTAGDTEVQNFRMRSENITNTRNTARCTSNHWHKRAHCTTRAAQCTQTYHTHSTSSRCTRATHTRTRKCACRTSSEGTCSAAHTFGNANPDTESPPAPLNQRGPRSCRPAAHLPRSPPVARAHSRTYEKIFVFSKQQTATLFREYKIQKPKMHL